MTSTATGTGHGDLHNRDASFHHGAGCLERQVSCCSAHYMHDANIEDALTNFFFGHFFR